MARTEIDALIQRWRAGDQKAAEALYNAVRDRVFHLAFGLLGDRDDAEEVAQDALAYALLNIDQYDAERSRFATWVHMITVSRSRDRLRRRRRPHLALSALLSKAEPVADPLRGPEQLLLRRDARITVWRAVQALRPDLREALLLHYWAEHTYREMGEILGVPLRTAQSRVRLAFQELASALTVSELSDLEIESTP